MAAHEFVHFRIDDKLRGLLDREVERLKQKGHPPAFANRSVVARSIVMAALDGEGVDRLTIDAGLDFLERALLRMPDVLGAMLPELLEEQMRQLIAEQRVAAATKAKVA